MVLDHITISMEEYKELLIIKGKYEELKSNQITNPIIMKEPTLSNPYTYKYDTCEELPKPPYKITCLGGNSNENSNKSTYEGKD